MPTPHHGVLALDKIVVSDLRNACRALSNAAATTRLARDAGVEVKDGAAQLQFLVRALCHEYGFDVVGMQERSARIATERIANAKHE